MLRGVRRECFHNAIGMNGVARPLLIQYLGSVFWVLVHADGENALQMRVVSFHRIQKAVASMLGKKTIAFLPARERL